MRITFVLTAFDLSGGERVAAIYAEELQRRGHQVFAVSPSRRPIARRDWIRQLLKGKGFKKPAKIASHFAASSVPHRMLDTFRPVTAADVPDADVIIATWWETAHWISTMPPEKGRRVHFIQHYEAFDYTDNSGVDAAWRLPMPKITISNWLTALARDRFGVRDMCQIPNSVDMVQFHAPPRARNRVPTIGMLYHPTAWKGGKIGIEAFELLRQRIPDARFIAFGMFPPTPENPLPAGATYVQHPPQDQIRDIYAQCDVWLCSSNGEGFHLPPLEAMACRCPVVSTRVGGPEDIIVDGVNGYLVPIGDAAGLAAGMEAVLRRSDEDWLRMSNAALATAERYTWADATDLLEAASTRVAHGLPLQKDQASPIG